MVDTNLLITIITSVVTICTTVFTVKTGNQHMQDTLTQELDKHNAVQDERICNLTKQVEKHNSVVERMFALEEKVNNIEKNLERLED